MTNEEWKEVEENLSHPYGSSKLIIDGYKITIQVQPTKKLHYELIVFINGTFNIKYCIDDCEERKRFTRQIKKYLLKKKVRDDIEKWNKRAIKAKMKPMEYAKQYTIYSPFWPSFSTLKKHLIANNKDIAIFKE
jgi:hypothetical protein